MPPLSIQKSIQIISKPHLESHRFFDGFLCRFFIDLGSIWEANLEPKGGRWKGGLVAKFVLGPPRRLRRRARRPEPSRNTKMEPKWKPPTPKMLPKWSPKPTKVNSPTSHLKWIFGIDFWEGRPIQTSPPHPSPTLRLSAPNRFKTSHMIILRKLLQLQSTFDIPPFAV